MANVPTSFSLGSGQPVAAEDDNETMQLVTFTIDDEEYGVNIMAVREIRAWSETTQIPNTPDYVRGVINLRGTIIPIFDLRARFGHGLTQPGDRHVVIIVAVDGKVVGLLVDAVSDILTTPLNRIAAVPQLERTVDNEYLAGLITVEKRMVTLIALDRLFGTAALNEAAGVAQNMGAAS